MSRLLKNKRQETEGIDFGDRFFAALLAPIFFNLAVLIVEGVFLKRTMSLQLSQFFYNAMINTLTGQTRGGLLLLFLLVPAIYGFIFGSKGVAEFIGHAFYSNMVEHRNQLITGIIWAILLGAAYCLQQLLSK